MRKLPVDISIFSELRQLDYVYVDKTEYMYHMITQGHRYFLSRPRRFGKSLLVSTLKEILSGRKELFNDLWISTSDYHWNKYGIILLDFSFMKAESIEEFEKKLQDELIVIARSYNITLHYDYVDSMLRQLILMLFEQYGQVAILIDEYDSPILHSLHNSLLATKIRDKIQQFFGIIKATASQVKFAFITGVSSFAKAGLFSGINDLQIITLDKNFAAICGYTDSEVDIYLKEYIATWADAINMSYNNLRDKIQSWYNGYSFGHNVRKVYNPFSLMKAIRTQEFENFWFQSGTPTFLVEMLKKEYKTFDPEYMTATKDFLSLFDVDTIPPLSLMFQAGYVTITGYDDITQEYILSYPNREVTVSFQKYLLAVFTHTNPTTIQQLMLQLLNALNNQDIERAITVMQNIFAHIPYQLHINQERFYHSLLIMICLGAGIQFHAEYSTSHGRIDLIMELSNIIYITEIKFNSTAQDALSQIENRRYYERFSTTKKHIILLGLSFNREPHNFSIDYATKPLSPDHHTQ